MTAGDTIIEARQVEKYYEQPDGHRVQVIAPTDLSICAGAIIALLGPSGSGKSTLLRMLTGLARPSAGTVFWHGQPVSVTRPNAAIVFQSFALFPWLTVFENVEAPLKALGVSPLQRQKRSFGILDTVGLDGFEAAYPKELSGGMKQRVGFARALVVEPEVLFMDEPFSALDVLTGENLKGELLDLWLEKKVPTRAIFIVTHNIEEAVWLADRVVVIGRNPARIRADFTIDLPQPRDRKSQRFLELVDLVYKVLTRPSDDQVVTSGAAAVSASAAAAPPRYPMLPHSRPGGMAGFLEILADKGGKEDVPDLAAELGMSAADLLPTLEAGALLGFLRVQEGDAELTPSGRAFAEADLLTRKSLFRDAARAHIVLLRQIESGLRAKSNRTLEAEFFLDILDDHFSPEEARRQLDTAIHWGRYAEMFDYDADTGRLLLTES